ncbi:hypothetical protein [Flexivirga alba]|uniref:Uncharacterized protein n=1 Tax=Flexivirga alba TaxID=702742 RepID=A0ABW2AHA5_9MICO
MRATPPNALPPDVYDLLGEREQAAVRGTWAERITALREGLNYESEFSAVGQEYSEADADGNLIVHPARDSRREMAACRADLALNEAARVALVVEALRP